MTTVPATPLTPAVENLYAVFAQYLPLQLADCCPHCTDADDLAALQSAPLRDLSAGSLERFSFKTMTTWGDADNFRHYLPRLLELVAWGDALDFEAVTSKLVYADWRSWPIEEQNAVEQFLMALWQVILSSTPYWSRRNRDAAAEPQCSVDEFLEGVVPLGSIEPYVTYWKNADTLPALQNLAQFVMGEGSALLRELNRNPALSLKEQQELLLLKQPWVRERLEAAFFAPPDGYTDSEFSLIVSRLDWLDAVQTGK